MIGIKTEQLHALFREAVNRGVYADVGEVANFRVIDAMPRMYISVGFRRKVVTRFDDDVEWAQIYVPEFVFSHKVARALWPEKWREHLAIAVNSDDPIGYEYKAFFDRGLDVR